MAVVSIKNKLRRGNLLVGNDPYIPTDFESIATVSVGSGGAASVTFSSIPSTYTHLQVRGISRTENAANQARNFRFYFNGDTASNYAFHLLRGDGSSVVADATANSVGVCGVSLDDSTTASAYGAAVIDILDYTNTNKYTTLRSLSGGDYNGGGFMSFHSTLWLNTNAITSIEFYNAGAIEWKEHTTFALYGIKVAS
jgi:hypothetical protein